MFRKLIYKRDQKGIYSRYLRNQSGWQIHLENCKKEIQKFMHICGDSVAILGSGWLLDVPMSELLAQKKLIYLVDIVHPQQVVHRYRKEEKVVFVQKDISGGAGQVLKRKWYYRKYPEELLNLLHADKNYGIEAQIDGFISLNILNQLDILLVDAIFGDRQVKFDAQIAQIREKIQGEHLSVLAKNTSCLITDFRQKNYDLQSGKHLETKELIYTALKDWQICDQWIWPFDLTGDYERGKRVEMEVLAAYPAKK